MIRFILLLLILKNSLQQQSDNAWSRDSKELRKSFQNNNFNNKNFTSNHQNRINQNQGHHFNENNNNRNRFPTNSNPNSNGESCKLNYEFDYFVLAIQWPQTFCLEKQQQCNSTIANKNNWLIHGLWPNQYPQEAIGRRNRRKVQLIEQKQSQPKQEPKQPLPRQNSAEYCCGPKYDQNIMYEGNLYNELLKKWPTLHPGNYHHGFWKHEWEKHGTCSRNIRQLKNQKKYFETILGLFNHFNLTTKGKIFEKGKYYSVNDVHRKLKKNLGNYRIRLECSIINDDVGNNKQQQQQQQNKQISVFNEIHICLNKTLHQIDCIKRDDYQCRSNNNQILFP